MTENLLSVRLHGIPIGTLEQDLHGRMNFRYLPDARRSLSLSLPLQQTSYDHHACEAYFGGLLPESEAARKAIAIRFGANPRNIFSLLKAIGYDCAGAVSLHHPDTPVSPLDEFTIDARPLSNTELAQHIRDLPRKPLFLGAEGLRLSLAGVQDKAAVCLINGQPALPLGGTPTTHILKPAFGPEPQNKLVYNEYLCLKLARAVGIPVPEAEIRFAEEIPYLLIKRYDRQVLPDGKLRRIHQEDFCQALGIPATMKYQSDGGPDLTRSFSLMLQLKRPAVERTSLLRRVLFNTLIGNCDAHAKNYSLLHHETLGPQLAPAYDLISTRFYPELTDRMAMKIGGRRRAEELYARQWQRFAEETALGYPMLRKMLTEVAAKLTTALNKERASLEYQACKTIADYIDHHSGSVMARLHRSSEILEA